YLERANLFIVPLDDRREWYRYHRLFADLLQARLRQFPPFAPSASGGEAALHRRASAWYEQNGLLAEAIEHVLAAEDFERAADLVEQAAEATLMRSEVATFLRWVDLLPDDLVCARPSLCVYHAWALLVSGHPWATIASRLQDVGEADGAPGEATALHAFISIFRGQIARAAELSRRALEQLPAEDRFSRGIAAWSMALSQFAEGNAVAGRQMLDEVIRVGQGTGNVMLVVFALCHLAELSIAQGELHKAQALYEQALALATDAQGQPLPIAQMALIGLGELAREWNDFDAALRCLNAGIALAGRWSLAGTMDAHLSLARLRQAQGDADGARREIERATDLAARFDVTEFDDLSVALVQAQLWVAQGEREAVWRWVEERQVEQDIEPVGPLQGEVAIDYRLHKYEQLVLARLLLSESRFTEALALLDRVQTKMEQRGRPGRVAEALALKALAFRALGDAAQALVCLERALALAEPEGYMRLFLDEGAPMRSLIGDFRFWIAKRAQQAGRQPDLLKYADKLWAAFPTVEAAAAPPIHDRQSAIPEPLSEREREVLRLLAAGMSSTEIAEHLVVSVNTVRTHVKSIYAKLGVHRRLEVARRAEELGLL
ncbi:MAG: tetratricopeptide repeat protein, partial [Anaerolineae bacterium]|nr:tetratricopeptide repeat protein [Anaerolineae bacterium]